MKTSREDVAMKIVEPVAAADFPKRDVVLRLVGTSPGAPARGTLYVDWRHPDPKCRASQNGPLPIQDDQVRMSIPIGAQLSFFPRNLAGYVVAPRDQVEVVAGAGPQVIEVPARPAGGIHGSVVRADGSPASSAFVTVFAGKLPPGEKDHSRINPNGSSASASFLVTLPLGGRYRVLAREQTDAHDVWTVSDEIALDENQPIAKIHLRLPEGKPLPIKVLDAKGAPVADQPVQLELSFSQPEGYSFSTQRGGRTGADGIARFERVSFDAPMAPLEANLYLTIPPGPFLGWRAPIDPRQAIEVRLQRGESAAGVLVEATTGKPIPDAEVRIMPRDFSAARFKANIRTRTNERGEFRFEGLEPLHYTGYIDGSVPKGTIIAREGGNTRFSYPDGVQPHTLRAGEHDVRWEVLLYPGSSLRAAD
jgi:hypothetical protein